MRLMADKKEKIYRVSVPATIILEISAPDKRDAEQLAREVLGTEIGNAVISSTGVSIAFVVK